MRWILREEKYSDEMSPMFQNNTGYGDPTVLHACMQVMIFFVGFSDETDFNGTARKIQYRLHVVPSESVLIPYGAIIALHRPQRLSKENVTECS